jgi:hypothetical protein
VSQGRSSFDRALPVLVWRSEVYRRLVRVLARGPAAAAKSEQSRATRVAASTVANRRVRRRRLVVHVSPRPSAGVGAPIATFGRSEVTTKPDLKGKYLLAATYLRYIVTPRETMGGG